DPLVPMEIKEGLRYVSAVRIGCDYCRTFRQLDHSGNRLLGDEFYDLAADPEPSWAEIIPEPWPPVFEMADEVLSKGGAISAGTLERLKARLTEAQIVEALFYMLIVGASHRLSHAFGIPAFCEAPRVEGRSLDTADVRQMA